MTRKIIMDFFRKYMEHFRNIAVCVTGMSFLFAFDQIQACIPKWVRKLLKLI